MIKCNSIMYSRVWQSLLQFVSMSAKKPSTWVYKQVLCHIISSMKICYEK